MNFEAQLAALRRRSDLPLGERARLSCRLAKQLEKVGEYERAYEALEEFWPDRHRPPVLETLDKSTEAEVLLRVGALAGWLGGVDETSGGQSAAKDLLTKSIESFERLRKPEGIAEARGDLALCYWREGSFDEARVQLRTALDTLPSDNDELQAILLIRAGIIEERTRRLNDALHFYSRAEPLVERSEDHALKGSFHFEHGLVLRRLSAPENREDYLDRALIEYAASSFHYEQAGNVRALARVETNLGYLFFTIGRYSDAHQHLDRARHLFLELKEPGTAAQINDTRARTLLAEGHPNEAERLARSAVRVLETSDQRAYLAEALTTQGLALARLGHHSRAKAVLLRAIEIAETTGDLEGAGRAKLSFIEEFGNQLAGRELITIYRSAIDLLKSSQDPATARRLIDCADKLIDTLERLEVHQEGSEEITWEGFSFKQHIQASEKTIIERALRDAGGSVTKAAHLLGFKHHQSLISLLNTRHKDLLKTRTAVRRRRRALFYGTTGPKRQMEKSGGLAKSQISVFHVEDNRAVARTVQDALAADGIHTDFCLSGAKALEILKSDALYDLIVVDNDLPGLSGLDLTIRVQSIPHRRNTPVIMLSGEDCESEAWRAGVKAFLRKPQGVHQLASTIKRLWQQRRGQKQTKRR